MNGNFYYLGGTIMVIVILCVIVLAYGFIKEAIEQNDPWYNTPRDPFRNNPEWQESRRRAHEICEKHKNDNK